MPTRMIPKRVLGNFSLFYLFAVVFIFTATLLRTLLLITSFSEANLSTSALLKVYSSGLAMDLLTVLYLGIPLIAYLLLAPTKWLQSRWHKLFIQGAAFLAIYLLLFGAVSEYFFWEEFQTRFNFIAVDYLVYTQEVVGNITESYPLIPILLAILCVTAGIFALLRQRILKSLESFHPVSARISAGLLLLALPTIAFVAPDLSTPLLISNNSYQNELASNGLYCLFSAFRHNTLAYTTFYPTLEENQALARVREALNSADGHYVNDNPYDFTRKIVATGEEKHLNIVLIVVESLSAEFCGAFGNPIGLTPHLDSLSKESLFFTNLYATGTRTVRGLEALSLSIPPTPGGSLVRQKSHQNLFSIGPVMRDKGYQTTFFYGGYSYFDNMQAFFSNIGFDVVDRSDMKNEEISFANAWGVCDGDLFSKCLTQFDQYHEKEKPFFSLIMTTSNHRPYTYPEGKIDIPSHTGRNGAVKYTDYAIGQFVEAAKEKPWFDNTVFVVVADHCASSAGRMALPVWNYHIPLLIYAPKQVSPGKVDTLCSQIDVMPTVLGLLNFNYCTRFFGKNILTMRKEEERAFISTYQMLGLFKGDKLLVLRPMKMADEYRYNEGSRELVPQTSSQEFVEEAVSYYQTTHAQTLE